MATRGDIRDGFSELLSSLSGTYDVVASDGTVVDTVTLDEDAIALRSPEHTEKHPAIVYHEDYRRVRYNGVGAGPDMVVYLDNGNVDYEEWREYMEAQFNIDVRASDESTKEPIYEALRTKFGQYQFQPWDETEIHDDVIKVDVGGADSRDSGDEESVIRGDQIEVRVTFYRSYKFSTDIIETINTQVDADDDGTIDYTLTTT